MPALAGLLCLSPALHAGLPELIASAKPAVVLVGTYAETDSPRFTFRGTGFVVNEGRSIVTNAHVLPDPSSLASERRVVVQLWRGPGRWEMREVQTQALARVHDLAVLALQGAPASASLRLGVEPLVREGSEVALMGFPIAGVLGFAHVTHRGWWLRSRASCCPRPAPRA